MSDASLLIPNLAAEEGASWHSGRAEAAARTLTRLWRCLFPPECAMVGWTTPFDEFWPDALGVAAPEVAALRPLEAPGTAFAWLNTDEALARARAANQLLAGASPDVVARVHDKAFAHGVADRERLLPASLRSCIEVFEPEALRGNPDAVVRRIDARLAAYPAWVNGHFTLKPRWGSSGRGRVPGRSQGADSDEVRGALARLAERGGALLEPWLDREADASVQLWVSPEGGVTLLGSLELLGTRAGVYRGHRGWIDYKARVSSGLSDDETFREAAAVAAVAAREEGYAGPCGIDGFRFAGAEGSEVRPLVEFNARFTAGTVVIGLLRRAWPHLRERHGVEPGNRLAFAFALAPPNGAWPETLAGGGEILDLGQTRSAREGPALLLAREPEVLTAVLDDDARSPGR